MDQEVTTAPEQEQPQQPPSTTGAELNLSDLASLRSILEVASSRGAFKAAELEAVGKAYNKLNTFLESVAAKKE
jgi:hypothetical protein